MTSQQHLYYHLERKLDVPLAELVRRVGSLLELASLATRPPVSVHWARYQRVGADVYPGEEHQAYLGPHGQDAVDGVFADAVAAAGPPEVGASADWVPNFWSGGRDSFSMVGLDEADRSEGHRVAHHVRFESNTCFSGVTWFCVGLAVPFAAPGPDFEAFAEEVDRRLGLTRDRRRWLLRVPYRNRYKTSRPLAPVRSKRGTAAGTATGDARGGAAAP